MCEESLAVHRERLGELKSLVARIAADVGLEAAAPLRGELAALGSRLEDVRASLATLAGAAEGRARRHADLRRTRDFLSAVQEVCTLYILHVTRGRDLSGLHYDSTEFIMLS